MVRTLHIVWEADFEYSELQGGMALIFFSIWLALDPLNMDDSALHLFILTWCACCVFLGVIQLLALILDRKPARRRAAFIAASVWSGMSAVFLLEWRATSTPWSLLLFWQCMVFSLGAAWGYVRLGKGR